MSSDEYFVEKSIPSAYVGIVPAAGVGSRLPGRKLSKEILPVGGSAGTENPVLAHLLTSMHCAGVADVRVVLREGKQDVADYLARDQWEHIRFDILTTPGTSGVAETVSLGLQDIGDRRIAFGFPDILFDPHDAFITMMQQLNNSNADVILGLFPTNSPTKMDMVDVDHSGRVLRIDIKPSNTDLALTWILAVWNPSFSTYLCDQVRKSSTSLTEHSGEAHLGCIFQLAIADGLHVNSVSFAEGRSLDIGTPDDLERASRWVG